MSAPLSPDELFRFHWLCGQVDEGRGRDAADALTRLGYGNGALKALDYWERLDPESDSDED